jgi:hypothetical protein
MKPTISKGLGALTPETWGEIYQAVRQTNESDRTGDYASREKRFVGRITGNQIITAGRARWYYAWEEVRRSTVQISVAIPDNPRVGTTSTDYAINLLEIGNTTTSAYGLAVTSLELDDAPGYSVSPIPNGTVVEIIMRRTLDGSLGFEFIAPNPIVGACEALLQSVLDGGTFGED